MKLPEYFLCITKVVGLCCTAAFPLIFLQLRKGPFLRTVLGYVGKRGWGVEGYWCFRKWVQWSHSIGGAKSGLIASNERDVQGFLRLHQLLARSLPRCHSRRACVRAYVHFVCVCVYMCMCVCVRRYMYIYACVYVYVYVCVYIHVYVYVYAYLYIDCESQYLSTVSCMCMCVRVHMYAYAYVCKYIYMCIFLQWVLHALWKRCFGH